ncbi:MAG: GHKL domain-containing protein [Ruminococcaceae bacterium]|nr:GHKL domain-containing protein [Oscillospiraceae bacterium]
MTEIIAANYQDIILNTARIFSSVFEIMLAFLLINNFFKPKPRLKKIDYIPFFLLAAGIILLQEYKDIGYIKYILECVFLVIMLFTMYQGKVRHKLTASAVFIALLAAAVIVSNVIYSLLESNMNVSADENSPFSELLRLTLSNIIMIPIAVLISTVLKDRSNGGFAFRMWIGLLIVPAVTLITFSVFQYIIETYELNQQIKAYIYLSCIGIIFINAVVFILFWFNQRQFVIKRENDLLTSQLSLQETSIKNLENAYNRTRTFRHDIKNHLLTMNILAENGDIDEIKKYLKEMSGIIDESSYVRITGISAVDAILNEKLYEAQSHNITTNYDVMKMEKNSIKPVDMCIILSNALDNAIEANQTIDDPDGRYIKLKMYGNGSYTVISVTNPTDKIPVKSSGNSYITSKKDNENHGFGLKSIENTAKKYDGEMLTKCEDSVFTLVIKLNALS